MNWRSGMRIKKIPLVLLILTSTWFSSCSTVDFASRKNKDILLSSDHYLKLQGTFVNHSTDTSYRKSTLFNNFTAGTHQGLCVEIIPKDERKLTVNLYNGKTPVQNELQKSVTLKGKYKKGYFKVKRLYRTKFVAGPLLWILGEKKNCIGLTKENNLVVLDSGGTGVLFLLAFPFFVAGGGSQYFEYSRIR